MAKFRTVKRLIIYIVQEALARILEDELTHRDHCIFNEISRELQHKRDYLVKSLRENGFNPTVPDGGYFIIADWTKLSK